MSDGRILLTGGTGFIGYEVARQLAAGGRPTCCLVARPIRAALLRPLDVEIRQGDLTRPESIARALEGVDTVVHLAARATFETYEVLRPSILDGSVALMQAAIDAGATRFVYASSLFVYGDQREPIDQTTPVRPRLAYGRLKVETEQALGRLAATGAMAFAALRLPHVYGARDLMFADLHRGRVIVPGRGSNLFSHLHVEDAARALIAAADGEWTGVSPIADDVPVTWTEFFDVVRRHYRRFREIWLPASVAGAGAAILHAASRALGRATIVTPDAVRGWNLSLPVAPGVLWDELGLAPRYPSVAEGIPAALDEAVAFRWRHPLHDRD